MTQIDLQKQVFNREYSNIINTQFSQLIKPEEEDTNTTPTVEEFFQLYDEIFYQIPKEGDVNSHRYLVNKSSEYLGLSETDIEVLLAEITTLRQELLDANKQINDLLRK
jgi:hypothetical protein